MKSFSRLLERIPAHPLWFSLYPALMLFAWNVRQMYAYSVLRALAFSLVILLVVFGLSLFLYRSPRRAALLSSLVLAAFFSYGHLYQVLQQQSLLPVNLARHSYLLALFALLLAAGGVLAWRLGPSLPAWTRILNIAGAALVVLPLLQIGIATVEGAAPLPGRKAQNTDWIQQGAALALPASPPDVYYIILDGYTREDVLKRMGFDNSQFLDALRQTGFTVLPCAQSNYDNTVESLPSTLNMNYLKDMGIPENLQDESMVLDYRGDMFAHSLVQANFERLGYLSVSFANKAPWANLTDVDRYYDRSVDDALLDRLETMRFYNLFLTTTAYQVVLDAQNNRYFNLDALPLPLLSWLNPKSARIADTRYKEYEKSQFNLEKLADAVDLPGPKFVSAHLMVTHSSFVFNPDGTFKEKLDESDAAYLQQVAFINQKTLQLVKKILAQSQTPPVIILQGDHGHLEGADKVKILNALYLPGSSQNMNAQFTPVNTFRFIFDRYFGGSYALLPDQSYSRQNPENWLRPAAPTCP